MTDVDEKAEMRPAVQCILCMREYDRRETDKYQPLGVFDNYCLCEDCLHKDKTSWGWRQ